MKPVLACVSLCAFAFLASCSQSSEKLLAAANKYHQAKKYQEASILYQKAIVKDKTNAEAYYRQGLNMLDDRKVAEAVGYLRRAVDLQPANSDAAGKLAEIYLTAYQADPKRYQSLLADVKDLDNKIVQRNPNSFDGLRIKALSLVAEGKYDESLPIFEKANQIKPYSRDLIGWYAQALSQAQKSDQAIALVQNMLARDKSWPQGYEFLFVYYGRLGDKEKAEGALRDHAKNNPGNETAVTNYANFLAASKRVPEAEAVVRQVLNDKKSFPQAHQIVGDFYVRSQQYEKAMTEYQAGAAEDPKEAVKYKQRLVALQAYRNHPAEAAQMAKELSDQHPKDLSVSEMYASILLQTGQRADAAKSLEELKTLVAKNPGDPVLHLDLARAYFSLNEKDKALTEALEAVHSEQKSSSPRIGVLVPSQTVAARIYEDRGQHAKAMELADFVLSAQPGNPDAVLIRDRALIGTGQAEKAQPELENLVKQFPKLNDAHLQLASLYLGQKAYDKAQTEFEVLNSATPPDIRGFVGLQTVKLATGKGEDAVKVMQELVLKNPTVLPYRYELANFQAALAGQYWNTNSARSKDLLQNAADNYKEILKTTANSAEVWLRLGVMQRQMGQYDAALASFEQAGNADPKSTQAFLNQALICDALDKKKEANDSYNKVLAIDPDNALALNNLAYMQADAGTNLDQAMTYAERAKKRAPENPDVSDTLGYVYYRKNLNGEAVRIFRQLSQDHPQHALYRLHLAMALLQQGDKQAARDEAAKALQSAGTPDEKNKINSFVSKIG
jgi:tetratricopeptide (TPR) repeat protein